MRHIYSYIVLTFLLGLIFVGCEKASIEVPQKIEVEVPTNRYINFNAQVGTRATLITDMKHDFAVTAFNYNEDWSTAVATAQPNVLYNQEITWNGSIHTYAPMKKWEENKKYTFFAHYPTTLTLSGSGTYGTPYITYSLPDNVENMVDIMTASLFDTDNSFSNTVGFTFKHRLTALGVQIRNLNKDTSIELDKLNITFTENTLKYNNATISLDESITMTRTGSSVYQGPYSLISSGSISIPALETVSVENALIFIPQEGTNTDDYLQGYITYGYNNSDDYKGFNVGRDMKAGRKYYLQMTFSAGAITIAIIESGEWTDKDVEIKFE